jgi:DNA-directed RNA polymerase I and III subunit RPAC1
MAPTPQFTQYNPRFHVGLSEERVTDVSSAEFPGHYPDEDLSWDLAKFKKVCQICSWC